MGGTSVRWLRWTPEAALLLYILFAQASHGQDTAQIKTTLEDGSWGSSLAFSPDGNTLAAGRRDHTVRLWDVNTGSHRATLEGHTSWVTDVAFSPDGSTLASGSMDATIRLWDVRTGQLGITLSIDPGRGVWSVAFSPDGHSLASGGNEGMVRLWNVGTAQLETSRGRANIFCGSLAFSPDGETLACGLSFGGLSLFDVDPGTLNWPADSGGASRTHGGTPKGTTVPGQPNGVGSVSFSPDGSKLAYGHRDATTRLWDLGSGQESTLPDKGYVGFSPEGHILAIGTGEDTVLRLWDAETGQLMATLEGHADLITSIAFSSDGTLASGSQDGTILLWDMSPVITDSGDPTAVSRVERPLPVASGLDPSTPNPFNSTTRIPYRIAAPGPVLLEVYNVLGQPVRTLVNEVQGAGFYQVSWDARDWGGAAVSTGVYLTRLTYPDGVKTGRLLFLE